MVTSDYELYHIIQQGLIFLCILPFF
jgi:hypothetical protein